MNYINRLLIFTAFALSASCAAWGQEARLVGRASVVKGDQLVIAGQRVRLFGIDAPEKGNPCFVETGRPWDCYTASYKVLLDLVGDFEVTCEPKGRDRFRRPFAVCMVNGKNINDAMVRAGLAVALPAETPDYVAAEAEAKAKKAGMWRGEFWTPNDYRESLRGN